MKKVLSIIKNNVQGLDIKKAVTEPITALHNASRASFTN